MSRSYTLGFVLLCLSISSWADPDEALYAQWCATCHGADLRGSAHGTALTGDAFVQQWQGKSWQALAGVTGLTMPPGQQHRLTAEQHGALARYVFRQNNLAVSDVPADDTVDSWEGAAGVAEMARSRSTFKNKALSFYASVSQAELNAPSDEDWLSWRRTLDGQAETPLKQVNKRNVQRLGLAWAVSMRDGSAQITPLVRDGIMFLVQPGLVVQALEADTGDLIWQYDYTYPSASKTLGGPMRNFALYRDMLYIATYDAALIALDAKTGALRWRTVKADYREGYTHSAGPIVGNGVILSGINGCERYKEDGCFITGHDANTGEELWRTSTIEQTQAPGQDSWGGLPLAFRAGGDTWIAGSYDADLDLFFIGTSQAKPWVAASRGMSVEDQALFTNSTLAIRPKSGEIVWHYQHIPGETLDMEVGFERVLATVDDQRFVFTVGKDGILWQLSAEDGQYVAHLETLPQNLFFSIDAETGRLAYREDILQAKIGDPLSICPGIYGGHNWQAMAYASAQQRLILPLHQLCGEITGRSVSRELGEGGFGGDSKSLPMPGTDGLLGKLLAIDVRALPLSAIWTAISKPLM